MKTYVSWISPAYPVVGAARRVEVVSNSVAHASLLIRREHPGCTFSLPREAEPASYTGPECWLDSQRGIELEVHL